MPKLRKWIWTPKLSKVSLNAQNEEGGFKCLIEEDNFKRLIEENDSKRLTKGVTQMLKLTKVDLNT